MGASQPFCGDAVASVQAAVIDARRRWGGQLDLTVVAHSGQSDLKVFADKALADPTHGHR